MNTRSEQSTQDSAGEAAAGVCLEALPERRLIRPGGSHRHIVFRIQAQQSQQADRAALALALVVDRSGSMSGGKLTTAKSAALAVLDRLEECDQIAVVTFDDRIEVLQPRAAASASVKRNVRDALGKVEARASTAMHEGWLTGCEAIAEEQAPGEGGRLARCFLLTDGLANVGLTDAEQIASQAAGVRERTAISTSTFGIGPDYDEALLGPMAVAGGGQFHHLRAAGEIAQAFVGELGEMLACVAQQVSLELELEGGAEVEVISQYWAVSPAGGGRWSLAVGDLLGGEERHVVVRLAFPASRGQQSLTVRSRLVWSAAGQARSSAWNEVTFSYGDQAACDAEARDPAVMHWVGLHHAERARSEALQRSRGGDPTGARQKLQRTARRIVEYAGADAELKDAVAALEALDGELASGPLESLRAKETTYETLRRSRGQRDHRGQS